MIRATLLHNNQSYDVADGAVFTENYNETLDSGTIIIQQLTNKMNIEPYDKVRIFSTDNRLIERVMCVDSYVCRQTSLNPPIYGYNITLMSETKILETLLCPSLSITKNWASPRTVYYYIQQYCELFGKNKFTFNSVSLISRFNHTECPEMQWNHPTLREVLNDLMMVVDCIPILKNGELSFIDISNIGSEISSDKRSGINYITTSRSSDDFVSDIRMNLVNVANNTSMAGTTSPDDCTRLVERIGFRNDESYLLTTENMRLQTSFPIWKIYKLIAYFRVQVNIYVFDGGVTTVHNEETDLSRDITDYVLEHDEWLTKDVYYEPFNNVIPLNADYRNRCLYYTRGSKNIENFNEKVETSFLWIDTSTYVWEMIQEDSSLRPIVAEFVQQWFSEYLVDHPEAVLDQPFTFSAGTYKNAQFELEYDAIDECVFEATKDTFSRNRRTIIDNQTNSYVDARKQGFLEYLKANRLGNEIALINGVYKEWGRNTETLIPQLAEKIDDMIIFRKEITFFKSYIGVNYQATKNYVLQNYFTGVKSKIRSWRVVSGKEAFVRGDFVKFFVNNNIDTYSDENMLIPSYSSVQDYLDNFKYCAIQTVDSNGVVRPENTEYNEELFDTNGIMCEFTRHIVGNSVVFTVRMNDNRYAGNYVSNYYGENERVEQKGISYTDSNGEFVGAILYFYNDYTPNVFTGGYNPDYLPSMALKPLISIGTEQGDDDERNLKGSDMVAKIPVRIYKDNKEILQISVQFEINENANNIFVGYENNI